MAAGAGFYWFLASIAASYAMTYMVNPGDMTTTDSGVELTSRSQESIIPISYGGTSTNGCVEVFRDVSSISSKYLVLMGTIGWGELGAIRGIRINDQSDLLIDSAVISTDGIVPKNLINPDFRDQLQIELYLGGNNTGAPALAKQYCPGKIDDTFIGLGLARYCIVIKRELDEGSLLSEQPNLSFIVDGVQIYDLSTGEVGSTNNGPSIVYDYLTNTRYGFCVSPDDIDLESFNTAALEAHNLELGTAGTLDTNSTPKTLLSDICKSFDSALMQINGAYTLKRYKLDAPKYSFTDSDIISQTIKTSQELNESKTNQYAVTWYDPANYYKSSICTVRDESRIAQDGVIESSLTYKYTTDEQDASYLAGIALKRLQNSGRLSLVISGLYDLEPLDIISISSDELQLTAAQYQVLSTQIFAVDGWPDSIALTLQQYDTSIYNPDVTSTSGSTAASPVRVLQAPTGLTVQCTGAAVTGGYQYILKFTAPVDAGRAGYRIQHRTTGTEAWITASTRPGDSVQYTITLDTNEAQDWRIACIGYAGQTSSYVQVLSVQTTPVAVLPAITNLVLLNHNSISTIETDSNDFIFKWDYNLNQSVTGTGKTVKSFFNSFIVTINGLQYSTKTNSFTYSFAQNSANNLSRTVQIKVQAQDYSGGLSPAVQMTCTNPQCPAIAGLIVQAGYDSIFVNWNEALNGRVGTLVKIYQSNGTTLVKTYQTNNVLQDEIQIPAGSYVVKAAHYDSFGQDSLQYNSGINCTVTGTIPTNKLDQDLVQEISNATGIKAANDAVLVDVYKSLINTQAAAENTISAMHAEVLGMDSQIADMKVKLANVSGVILGDDGSTTNNAIDLINASLSQMHDDISTVQTAQNTLDTRVTSVNTTLTASLGTTNATLTTLQGTVATNNTALTTKYNTVQAQVNNNKSLYDSFVSSYATDKSATSTSISTLNSSVGSINSSIAALQKTVSDADTAISTNVTNLTSTVNANKAAYDTFVSTQSTKNTSMSASITTLNSSVAGHDSSITALTKTVSDNNTATSTSLTALNSTVAGHTSSITALTKTVSDNNSAQSSSLNSLSATVNTNKSAFDSFKLAQTSTNTATSSSLTSLTATVNTNKSAFDSFVTSYATDKSATSSSLNSLSATVNTNKSAFDSFKLAQTSTNTATSSSLNSLTAVVNTNKATYDAFVTSYATDKSATSSSLTALNSTVAGHTSSITALTKTVTDNDSAQSTSLNSLTSVVNANKSAFDSFKSTQTSTNTATSTSITALNSTVAGHTSSITALTKTVSDNNSAQSTSLNSLSATVTGHTASISALSNTVSTNNSAQSTSLNNLTATVNANKATYDAFVSAQSTKNTSTATALTSLQSQVDSSTASITALSNTVSTNKTAATTYTDSKIATVNSTVASVNTTVSALVSDNNVASSKYVLQLTSGGVVAGFGISTDSVLKTSAVSFVADYFSVTSTSTGVPIKPFVVSGSTVYLSQAAIADASILNAKIANATITGAKIASATITSANIVAASIGTASIADASITTAKIASVIQSTDYVAGSDGWKIGKDGTAEFNNATFRGTVYASGGNFSGTVYAEKLVGGAYTQKVYASADVADTATKTTWYTARTVTVSRPMAIARTLQISGAYAHYTLSTTATGSGSSPITNTSSAVLEVRVLRDGGTVVASSQITVTGSATVNPGGGISTSVEKGGLSCELYCSVPGDSASHSYALQYRIVSATSQSTGSVTCTVGSSSTKDSATAQLYIESGDLT